MYENASGQVKGIVAFRLKPGSDVLQSVVELCEKYDIRDGIIMSALGSWKKAVFCNPINLPSGKVGYGEPTIVEGNYALVNLSGMICHDEEGHILPHIHMTISNAIGDIHAGHIQTGCEVLLTTDIVIGVFEDIVMGRRFDEELGVPLFAPRDCTAS